MTPASHSSAEDVPCEEAAEAGTGGAHRLHDPQPGPVRVRIPHVLFEKMKADLRRPHPFAAERVGFLSVTTGRSEGGELLVLGIEYHVVPEAHYVEDHRVGVRIGVEAIRGALERIRSTQRGLFHVHMHDYRGVPGFSGTDRREQPRLVESFQRVGRRVPHGVLVLSDDSANAWVWLPGETEPVVPRQITIVGYPMALVVPDLPLIHVGQPAVSSLERFSRQSFLGPTSQSIIERARLGIVGLGGGGSHVIQQLAHIGFGHLCGFDGDLADETNLNRLIGAREDDAKRQTPKTEIAERLVRGLLPDADIVLHPGRWQDRPEVLRACDIVIGCVDSFAERRELETACRRYLIPYIDIGMDVHQIGGDPPRMAGQVILSMPDGPCMFCLGFLTEERLAREAAQYGAAGGRPQVVWPNGVLASTAIGVAMDIVTGWTRQRDRLVYLSYDGNTGEVKPHVRLRFLRNHRCEHYGVGDVGDPILHRIAV